MVATKITSETIVPWPMCRHQTECPVIMQIHHRQACQKFSSVICISHDSPFCSVRHILIGHVRINGNLIHSYDCLWPGVYSDGEFFSEFPEKEAYLGHILAVPERAAQTKPDYVEVPNPEEEVEERTVQGKGKTSGGTNDWKKIYLSRLLRAINEEKRFPSYEKKKGFEDSVKVSLTILPSGRVKEYRLVQESRYPGFNMEARRIIREAVFPTFPEELDMDEITISFSMDFKLEYSE